MVSFLFFSKGLWGRTIGTKTTYILDAIILSMCFASAVIYCGILGDVFTPLLYQSGLVSSFYINYVFTRSTNILLLTNSLLLPMSLIKNLSALSMTSFLGAISVGYTTMFICYRSLDGSYTVGSGRFVRNVLQADNGEIEQSLIQVTVPEPKFDHVTMWNFNFSSLVLMCNYGLAYVAHYNAPIYYREMKTSDPSASFSQMVLASFIILIGLYTITMIAGYRTFGDTCKGNILLNYHEDDKLAMGGRIATGLSILFGFPLVMTGARESLINVSTTLGYPQLNLDSNRFLLVFSMLSVVSLVAVLVDDVSIIVGLNGAIMGSCITYVCPVLINTKAVGLTYGKDSSQYQHAMCRLLLVVPLGFVIASLGVYMTVQKAMS
jgi:amino acid permease